LDEELLKIEGFHVIRLLGRGGMGEVYLARDMSAGNLVAIKVLSQDLVDDDATLERFVREAILTSNLRHPNVVRVHELGEDDGVYYISMEYVEGPTLKDVLHRGALQPRAATSMMCQVLDGVGTAHGQGIIHCDLKPGNILLANGDLPKVSDLGIAHTRGPIHGNSSLPAVGRATPFYVAPEQCRRGGTVDHRTDIYSLGATFFHMLCGLPPFLGKTREDLMDHHLNTPAPDARTRNALLSGDLAGVILRMLAKDPDERPQQCSAIGRELGDVLRDGDLTSNPGPTAPDHDETTLEETTPMDPPEA